MKKTFRTAFFISIGTTLGGCILPRLMFKNGYNGTYPSIGKEACIWFLVGFVTAAIFTAVFDGIKRHGFRSHKNHR